jgi:CheY-like chemotaxis protein
MNKKLRSILLVDDDHDDNFFHEREIKKYDPAINVIAKKTGLEALDYLKSKKAIANMQPDLIFLDINMPGMNGWEFLKEYNQLDKKLQSEIIVIMLTTSDNPDDVAKAKTLNFVSDYMTKPMTRENMNVIVNKYFTNH